MLILLTSKFPFSKNQRLDPPKKRGWKNLYNSRVFLGSPNHQFWDPMILGDLGIWVCLRYVSFRFFCQKVLPVITLNRIRRRFYHQTGVENRHLIHLSNIQWHIDQKPRSGNPENLGETSSSHSCFWRVITFDFCSKSGEFSHHNSLPNTKGQLGKQSWEPKGTSQMPPLPRNQVLLGPYFLGGGGIGWVPLDCHETTCHASVRVSLCSTLPCVHLATVKSIDALWEVRSRVSPFFSSARFFLWQQCSCFFWYPFPLGMVMTL